MFRWVLFVVLSTILFSCKREPVILAGDFPEEVGKIIKTKCATAGCHNSISKYDASGLDLSSWHTLFKGSKNNSVIIPYRSDLSSLYYSISITDHNGPDHDKMMPKNGAPLSDDEITTIRNWINEGAPNHAGMVPFPDYRYRKKIFVANQGCDIVTVFDAKTKLIMRTIDVGRTNSIESPHDMFVSPDGKYLYMSFFANSMFQRYDTQTGMFAGEIEFGDWGWHSMSISGNSKYALVSHLNGDGKVVLLDLEKMEVVVKYQGSGYFIYPHGSVLNYDGTLAYITAQQGNFLYKMDLSDPMNPEQTMVSLEPGNLPTPIGNQKPYEVEFSPDYTKYYVACQGTNDIRIFNTSNDSLTAIVSTPGVPQLMSFSEKHNLMFITCMEDSSNTSTLSSVAVMDTRTNTIIKTIESGYQPRGLVVDDNSDIVYVANRNISPTGWTPHHTTSCGGRNGYVTLIDIKTLELKKDWYAEVSVDPYCIAIMK